MPPTNTDKSDEVEVIAQKQMRCNHKWKILTEMPTYGIIRGKPPIGKNLLIACDGCGKVEKHYL